MKPFRDLSLQNKLVTLITLTSSVVLVLACLAFMGNEVMTFRKDMVEDLTSVSEILERDVTAALLFNDDESAASTLASLSAMPDIQSAFIFSKEGVLLASYVKNNDDATNVYTQFKESEPRGKSYYFKDNHLDIYRPVVSEGEVIATLCLRAGLDSLVAKLQQYVGIVCVVFLTSLFVAFVLSSRLQRVISWPILDLVDASTKVAQRQDYAVRVEKKSDDEVGQLVGAFNKMISQIEEHDLALSDAFHEQRKRGDELQRKNAEWELAEKALTESKEALRQAQKMEAVGRLAGGIAHDFNNLLTAISGFSELLLETIQRQDPRHEFVVQIMEASDRAASLTRQLLAFSRKQILQPRVINMNDVISGSVKILQRLIGADVALLTDLNPTIDHVKVDPGQMEQVIMNLAVNARDAMPDGGTITITTTGVTVDEEMASRHKQAHPGPHMMMQVSDTGSGIGAEILDKIFEPFFTTKEVGKGTGLGLSTVYGIIDQSDGFIELESELDKGTTFKMYFPSVAEKSSVTVREEYQTAVVRGSETILLVEDEAHVRKLVLTGLQSKGFEVLEAASPEAALQISEEYDGPIHLMVSDMVMQNMNGVDLAERVSGERPEMKVLFMSGYTEHPIFRKAFQEAAIEFVHKPFSMKVVAQKIRDMLDRVS